MEGVKFVERFKENLAAGRLVEAFGPHEHIDVRETARRRDIKRRVIAKLVGKGGSHSASNGERRAEPVGASKKAVKK